MAAKKVATEVKADVEQASVATSAKGELVRYWAPQNASYAVATPGGLIGFSEHYLLVDPAGQPEVVAELERSQGFGTDFYRVVDEGGDTDYQERFMSYLMKMIPQDPADQVSTERGLLALLGLFSQSELEKHGITRGMAKTKKERLIMLAYQNKKVEGLI